MQQLFQALILVLVTGVVFVNGWTDAPNAIATAVTTQAISFRRAVWLCAVFNFAGLVGMSLLNASVADTIASLVDFGSSNPLFSLAALCAALASIVFFAVGAWLFAIPTSESHALIAGITGAALALNRGEAIAWEPWKKVLLGLVLSLILGYGLGRFFTLLLGRFLRRQKKESLARFQVLSACASSFMHGAQDGQKFAAIYLIGEMLSRGVYQHGAAVTLSNHVPVLLLCALTMALGTSVGGKRIVVAVGEKMTQLEQYQGVCADMGSAVCLLVASLTGIPMSTTHTKTTAVMGAGQGGGKGTLDLAIVRGMLTAWLITFPVCGAIGFLFTRLFLHFLL